MMCKVLFVSRDYNKASDLSLIFKSFGYETLPSKDDAWGVITGKTFYPDVIVIDISEANIDSAIKYLIEGKFYLSNIIAITSVHIPLGMRSIYNIKVVLDKPRDIEEIHKAVETFNKKRTYEPRDRSVAAIANQ